MAYALYAKHSKHSDYANYVNYSNYSNYSNYLKFATGKFHHLFHGQLFFRPAALDAAFGSARQCLS